MNIKIIILILLILTNCSHLQKNKNDIYKSTNRNNSLTIVDRNQNNIVNLVLPENFKQHNKKEINGKNYHKTEIISIKNNNEKIIINTEYMDTFRFKLNYYLEAIKYTLLFDPTECKIENFNYNLIKITNKEAIYKTTCDKDNKQKIYFYKTYLKNNQLITINYIIYTDKNNNTNHYNTFLDIINNVIICTDKDRKNNICKNIFFTKPFMFSDIKYELKDVVLYKNNFTKANNPVVNIKYFQNNEINQFQNRLIEYKVQKPNLIIKKFDINNLDLYKTIFYAVTINNKNEDIYLLYIKLNLKDILIEIKANKSDKQKVDNFINSIKLM